MFDVKWWHDSAVMNPPFTLADDMVNHLIDCNVQLICAFQRTQYMEGAKRYDAVFKDNPPAHILLFTERVSMEIEGQARLVSSGMMAFSWYIWVAGYSGPTQLHWLTAKPHFENDRRLVGTGIEVRDLLSWDKDKMFYRFECEGCGHIHIDERVKGQKGDWEPVCSRCCTPLPSRLSNNRSKFDTKWRIV
jgi:hypothetical protein